MTLKLVVSMKWAMLVVSEVLTRIVPSGLMPMPSGSTPTGTSASTVFVLHVDHRDHVVVLVGDVERIALRVQDEELRVGTGLRRLRTTLPVAVSTTSTRLSSLAQT